MTTIGDIIFILVWFGALVFGIILMSNGWSLMWSKPKPYDPDSGGPKKIHPELEGVEDGEELLVVYFGEQSSEPIDKERFKLDSPALHEYRDPLNKSLQERIDALNEQKIVDTMPSEYQPPGVDEDDEDDDDGGDLVALSR